MDLSKIIITFFGVVAEHLKSNFGAQKWGHIRKALENIVAATATIYYAQTPTRATSHRIAMVQFNLIYFLFSEAFFFLLLSWTLWTSLFTLDFSRCHRVTQFVGASDSCSFQSVFKSTFYLIRVHCCTRVYCVCCRNINKCFVVFCLG